MERKVAIRGYKYLHFLIDAVQAQSAFAVGVSLASEVSSVRIGCQHCGPVYSRSTARLDLEYYVCHAFSCRVASVYTKMSVWLYYLTQTQVLAIDDGEQFGQAEAGHRQS